MTIPVTPSISLSPSTYSSPGQTITASVSLPNRPAYHGHPSITGLTSITPKIVVSRVPSGDEGFSILVSGSETTCNAGDAFLDLDYRWNFGDSNGVEVFTDHWNGKTVNANDSQQGPEASYLYRNAGTYTITLTVSGKDENGTIFSASTTTLNTTGQYYRHYGGATGGTYTLTYEGETTSAIAFDATDATVLSALQGLTGLDTTNCDIDFYAMIRLFGDRSGATYTFTADMTLLTGTAVTPSLRTEVASTSSASVTVSDLSGYSAQYFDSGYGGENGSSIGTELRPYTAWSSFTSFLIGGSNRVLYIKRGSSWTASTAATFGNTTTGIRILTYGSGAKPILTFTGNGFNVKTEFGEASVPDKRSGDFVVTDLDIRQDAIDSTGFRLSVLNNGTNTYPYGSCVDCCIDNCDYTVDPGLASADGFFISWNKSNNTNRGIVSSGLVVWGCTASMASAKKQGLFISHKYWFGCVGLYIVGGDGSLTLDHHLYINMRDHCGVRYTECDTGSKSYCFNNNCDDVGGLVQYYVFDGCDVKGTLYGFDFSNSNNSYDGYTGYFDNSIVQFCKVHCSSRGIFCYNSENITARYSKWWNHSVYHTTSADKTKPTTWKIYSNQFGEGKVRVRTGQTLEMYDCVFDGGTGFCVSMETDTVDDDVTSDRNIYYSPSEASPFQNEAGGSISFATWQSYGNDANGSVQDPLFDDPTNGIFTADPTLSIDWPAAFTNLEYSINGGVDWLAYTDDADQSIGASLSANVVILFRANVGGTGDQTISGRFLGSSLDVAEETYSALLTEGPTYYRLQAGGLYFTLSVG